MTRPCSEFRKVSFGFNFPKPPFPIALQNASYMVLAIVITEQKSSFSDISVECTLNSSTVVSFTFRKHPELTRRLGQLLHIVQHIYGHTLIVMRLWMMPVGDAGSWCKRFLATKSNSFPGFPSLSGEVYRPTFSVSWPTTWLHPRQAGTLIFYFGIAEFILLLLR